MSDGSAAHYSMGLGGLALLVLILAANAAFFARMVQVFRLVSLGQGTLGLNRLPERVRDLMVKGFGQSLVLRTPSGIGHALIFWGFFVLTYGTTEGLISSVVHGFSFAWMGPIYPLMNTMQDLFAVLVLFALAAAVWRRLVTRPKRLEASFAHTLDAMIIIGLITLLICAYFGMQAIAPKPGMLVASNMVRILFIGWDPSLGRADFPVAYAVCEWTHNLVVLGFLVYIPYSKHLHIMTALPNLFFRDEHPAGRIDKLDLEDENAESFGVSKISDFSRKELLDLTACTECGRCQEACPAYNTGKPLSPKKVITDLKDHLFHAGPQLLADPPAETGAKLYGDVITEDVLWSCTTCRACEEVCPVEIQPMTKLIKIRQGRVLMEGDLPAEAQNSLRNIENQSNPWGLAQEERGKWAEEMGVKTLAEDADVEYLFYVGCAGSYDQRYLDVTRAFAKLLGAAGVKFGILGAEECCTGDSAKRIGNELLAQAMAQQNVETFKGYGVKKVVTACPHCFNSIKNEFPEYGGDFEVIHHTQLLSELIRDGKLALGAAKAAQETVAYHDSCYLARYNGVADAPRDVIAGSGALPVELERNHELSFCCGAGGGRMWMEETIGKRVNVERAEEAVRTGAETIATACPFCMTMLSDGVKAAEREEDVQQLDVAQILERSIDFAKVADVEDAAE